MKLELNKDYILTTLSEEKLWKVGESDTFIFENWELTLRKEEDIYKPFMYLVQGKKKNSNETIGSRYTSMEKAFLHILNHFNENANVKNIYEKLSDALNML